MDKLVDGAINDLRDGTFRLVAELIKNPTSENVGLAIELLRCIKNLDYAICRYCPS